LISWRAQEPALRAGTIASYDTGNEFVTSYVRASGDDLVLVLHNMSKEPQIISLQVSKSQPTEFTKLTLSSNAGASLEGRTLMLPPYTTAVLKP